MAAAPSSRCSPCSLIDSPHLVPDAAANKALSLGPAPAPAAPAALSVPQPLPAQGHPGLSLYIPIYPSRRMGDGDSPAGNPPPNTAWVLE